MIVLPQTCAGLSFYLEILTFWINKCKHLMDSVMLNDLPVDSFR